MNIDTALTAMFFGVFAGGALVIAADCIRDGLRQRRTRRADVEYVDTLISNTPPTHIGGGWR